MRRDGGVKLSDTIDARDDRTSTQHHVAARDTMSESDVYDWDAMDESAHTQFK